MNEARLTTDNQLLYSAALHTPLIKCLHSQLQNDLAGE